ncbi:MAG: F0F1 ATP synthase subunit delta [Paramuribaculum sp.]|nr:F0F1 ATP synthase subunit delta [Paramuribaculum sp.]
MNEGLIPRRYAKALYEYAASLGKEERIYDMMKNLSGAFETMPQIRKALANPFVDAGDKKKVLATAAGAVEDDTVFANLLSLLDSNRRFDMAQGIALAYEDMYRSAKGIKIVKVQTASPLDPALEQRLKKIIAEHLHGDTMEYTASVNPDLIGGFTVQTGNERLDASVANELKQLRLNLISK